MEGLQYIPGEVSGFSRTELARIACEAGVRWIQLRIKEGDDFEWEKEAVEIVEVCREYDATIIINDRVDIAARMMADGVHLGKSDMDPLEARALLGEKAIIGATANTFSDVQLLVKKEVDYIGLGPFRFTETKKDLSPVLGIEGYQLILQQINKTGIKTPVYAIGGIVEKDIQPLMETGVSGIVVSGLITNSADKVATTKNIISCIKKTHIC